MITLPFPPRRAYLQSFWLIMSLVGGLLTGILMAYLISNKWFIFGIVLFMLLSLPGLIRKRTKLFTYRAWNKLVREYSRFARQWIIFISFYVILMAVGRTGSPLKLAKPVAGKSLWGHIRAKGVTVFDVHDNIIAKGFEHKSWKSIFLAWTRKPNNWWVCCLLPFFLLISLLDIDDGKSSSPSNIYTLF